MRLFAERYLNQDEDGFDLDGEYDEEEIKKKSGDGEGDDDDDDEEIIDSFTMQDLDEDKQLGDEDDEINLRREDR
jgi:hypothetical protein